MFTTPLRLFLSVLTALTALAALQFTRIILHKRHCAREAKKRGCLPPPRAPDRGLLGINLLRESVKATKDGWGPQWMHQTLNSMGPHVHTIRAPVFDYELIVTRDVENVKAIFNSQSADFDIGPHRERTFKSAFGLGVMTSRGARWKHSRGLIRPQFARSNIASLSMFEKHVQSLLKQLQPRSDAWTSRVDLQPLFQSFTLDTGTEFLYGQSVFSLDPEVRGRSPISWDPQAPDVAGFGHHLDSVKSILDRQGALAKYSWLVRSTEFSTHVKALHGFVDYFVNKKLQERNDPKRWLNSSDSEKEGKFVLLDELLKETQDPLELRNETLNVLHASRDTTAALMGWVFYFLAKYDNVFRKLRMEIMSQFADTQPEDITFNGLWSCSYLQWVINETVRFVGIVPMNERAAIRDSVLPRGGGEDGLSPVFIPKGRQILIPTYSMQHRADIWGADVDEYNPERWRERRFGFDFIPFGGGPRQCIGQQFAKTEVMYVVVRLLQTFDVVESTESPGTPMSFHHTIENRSGNGVQVRMHAVVGSGESADATFDFEPKRKESIHEMNNLLFPAPGAHFQYLQPIVAMSFTDWVGSMQGFGR